MNTLTLNRRGGWALALAIICVASNRAGAGTVAGTGGSTEITQIANNLQLAQSYAQQVAGYVRQGLQLQNELKNLIANPLSLLGEDVGGLINGIGQLMNTGQSIGHNMEQINRNFSANFKNPVAGNYATMFTRWNKTSTDTLEGVLKSVGATRDQYASNQDALRELYNRSQSSGGNLQALQTLSQINIRQIQQMQSLQELIASEATAAATYMAAQTAKDQKTHDMVTAADDKNMVSIPSVTTAPAPKWKNFGK